MTERLSFSSNPKRPEFCEIAELASIYAPNVRNRIRLALSGKSVLMVDLDGVLTEDPDDRGRKPNADAIDAVKQLASQYYLMLWTQGGRGTSEGEADIERFLRETGLKQVFSIIVRYRNHLLQTTQEKNDFSESVRNNFIEQSKTLGIEIVKEFSVNPNENDFKTIILQMKKLKLDAVYGTFAFYPSQGAFSKQAKELGLNLTIYSTSGTEIPDLVKSFPEVEGTIYGYIAMGPKEADFYKKYQARFNSFPSPSASSPLKP